MFTGLVRERGRLTAASVPSAEGGRLLVVGSSTELVAELEIGASVAVSGVCLTVVGRHDDAFDVELSPETIDRTTLGELVVGDAVNLEPALRMGDPLGGHWVQGHVDTTTAVVGRSDVEAHRVLWFDLPGDLVSFVVEKGSVTVDGVSLTVADLDQRRFSVALIPHTLAATTLGQLAVGDLVNLEADILAKYVRRSLEAYR